MAGWQGQAWKEIAKLPVSTANTANPPTQAELVAEFGAAADKGAGFIAMLDDAGGGANVYLIGCDGANYFYVALTVGA
jgi:hypothetical protein